MLGYEVRTADQLRQHYEVERTLADRLRQASRQERRTLYAAVYSELFRLVPDHPQVTQVASPELLQQRVLGQLRMLRPFLRRDAIFLEIGPGDGALANAVARSVQWVFTVDVTAALRGSQATPANVLHVLIDGCAVPLRPGSVDVAYSNQLMEHLHPDDALEQLRSIYQVLAPGGVYVCITPNRLNGPHDISGYFDDVATGLHLKEYTTEELVGLFQAVGFSRIEACIGVRGKFVRLPASLVCRVEEALTALPPQVRPSLARSWPLRKLLGIRLVGWKGRGQSSQAAEVPSLRVGGMCGYSS